MSVEHALVSSTLTAHPKIGGLMTEKNKEEQLNPECFGKGDKNAVGCKCKAMYERLISKAKV
jgi:hypothetical protein